MTPEQHQRVWRLHLLLNTSHKHVAPNYPQFSAGLVNPQFSTACVEVSSPESTWVFLLCWNRRRSGIFQFLKSWTIQSRYKPLSGSRSRMGLNVLRSGSIPVPQIVDDTVEVVIGNLQVIAAAGSCTVHGEARRDIRCGGNDPELSR